ncbi:hypothetical protein [Bdellovibrio sp. HCB337]|uniref:hypothetical protein n=1 Tax=Bdellovibrio sp. HCB337 TaxID=3394358 RepID=UPI0039A5209B
MKTKKTPQTTDESKRLREVIREIGLPLRRLQDVILLTPEECLTWWSNKEANHTVNPNAFSRLTEIVAIGENHLYTGDYDRDLARKRMMGDYLSLPHRYEDNQNSFLRTSAHIIRYIVLTRGQHFADQILYSLNVSPMLYDNLDVRINLTYFADLLEALSKHGFQQEELDTLASVIFLSLQETKLGQSFKESENLFDIYKTLATNFDYFDSNFEYKSRFVGKKYILKTTLPLTQHPELKGSPQKIKRLMRYRRLLSAWFPYLGGMAPLFPKTEVVRFSDDVVETQYVFDLKQHAMRPTKLLVV